MRVATGVGVPAGTARVGRGDGPLTGLGVGRVVAGTEIPATGVGVDAGVAAMEGGFVELLPNAARDVSGVLDARGSRGAWPLHAAAAPSSKMPMQAAMR